MDRIIAPALRTVALACVCIAAVLVLAGFIEYLQTGRWPDQSVLRLAYDARLISARWFLAYGWGMTVRNLLEAVPAVAALLAAAPLCWWLGARLAAR